jgi:hypothetical protein
LTSDDIEKPFHENPLKRHLRKNKDFYEKFFSFYKKKKNKNICSSDEAFAEAKKLLHEIDTASDTPSEEKKLENLARTLEDDLDFSDYVADVIRFVEAKKYNNMEHSQTGEALSFIVGDAITAVRIIRYEPFHSIIVKGDSKEIEIPSTHFVS